MGISDEEFGGVAKKGKCYWNSSWAWQRVDALRTSAPFAYPGYMWPNIARIITISNRNPMPPLGP